MVHAVKSDPEHQRQMQVRMVIEVGRTEGEVVSYAPTPVVHTVNSDSEHQRRMLLQVVIRDDWTEYETSALNGQ